MLLSVVTLLFMLMGCSVLAMSKRDCAAAWAVADTNKDGFLTLDADGTTGRTTGLPNFKGSGDFGTSPFYKQLPGQASFSLPMRTDMGRRTPKHNE